MKNRNGEKLAVFTISYLDILECQAKEKLDFDVWLLAYKSNLIWQASLPSSQGLKQGMFSSLIPFSIAFIWLAENHNLKIVQAFWSYGSWIIIAPLSFLTRHTSSAERCYFRTAFPFSKCVWNYQNEGTGGRVDGFPSCCLYLSRFTQVMGLEGKKNASLDHFQFFTLVGNSRNPHCLWEGCLHFVSEPSAIAMKTRSLFLRSKAIVFRAAKWQ